MSLVSISSQDGVTTLCLQRGKVNAVNIALLEELTETFSRLSDDRDIEAVVLTGSGPFFSFGFDIPELYECSPLAFTEFLRGFTGLVRRMFVFPRPIVAAINGHAIAGGCILATACDRRVMVAGKAKISLNEVTFGSSIFQSAVELMRFWVGSARAQEALYSGRMYSADEAKGIGLVDRVVSDDLLQVAMEEAIWLADSYQPSFAEIKLMLRQPVIDRIMTREEATISKFVEIWYSEPVRARLRQITIRD